jgi:hypothetical protein
MGEGLFRGCCAPERVGMVAAWRSRHMVDVWFAGTMDAQTCQQIHKRTHGILCEFGCDQESVATSTWVNSVIAVPALIPGPHLGAHESRTVSRTDWFCELFPNRCIVEDLIAPWAKSAAAFRKEVYF